MTESIGFIGVGQMGEPMVNRLLGAQRGVLVYARKEEVRTRMESAGAALADSVADLAERCDIVISCLFSDAQLRELCLGPDGLAAHARPGITFISHTTGNVDTLTELADFEGLVVIDAPVSGTSADVAAGTLTVLVGGPTEAVARITPILRDYANPVIATGELGTALHLKLINNLLFAANLQLIAAATELGEQFAIDPERLLDALAVCSGGSMASSYVQTFGGLDAFAAGTGPYLRKDVSACFAQVQQAGADSKFLRAAVSTGPLDMTNEPT